MLKEENIVKFQKDSKNRRGIYHVDKVTVRKKAKNLKIERLSRPAL